VAQRRRKVALLRSLSGFKPAPVDNPPLTYNPIQRDNLSGTKSSSNLLISCIHQQSFRRGRHLTFLGSRPSKAQRGNTLQTDGHCLFCKQFEREVSPRGTWSNSEPRGAVWRILRERGRRSNKIKSNDGRLETSTDSTMMHA
jgi:hypothetical protein